MLDSRPRRRQEAIADALLSDFNEVTNLPQNIGPRCREDERFQRAPLLRGRAARRWAASSFSSAQNSASGTSP